MGRELFLRIKRELFDRIKSEKTLLWGIAWTALLLLGAAIVFSKTETAVAKRFDIAYGFHWLIATALVGVVGFAINAKELFQAFRNHLPSRGPAIAVALLTLFAAVVALQWIPLKHRVLSDESSWEGMAIQMYYNSSGGVCNQGLFQNGGLECIEEVNNFKGKAMALVELLAYVVSKPGRDAALRVNLPLFLLSIPLLFLVVSHSTGRKWLGVTAAGMMATLPTMLFQSRAASTEVLYIFLLLLIVHWMQLLATKEFHGKQLVLLLPLMGIFAQTRQETVFAFLAFAWYWIPWFRTKAWHAPVWATGAILSTFPILATICGYKGYNFQGGDYAPHSIHNLAVNFWDNVNVMLGLQKDPSGLLTHPWFTTQTILLFIGLLVTVLLALSTKRYRRQLWMGLLFFIQPIVIMVNVSGNFTIDINQRYVLTMFPAFAILSAIGWHELLEPLIQKWGKGKTPLLLSVAALLLGGFLVVWHKADFVGNVMYHKNKLLEEEEYLHAMVRDSDRFPDSALYVYARPWQMICSGRSAISESRMVHWNDEEFSRWQKKTGGHIYLVRGQDGYGTVNRKSRVVGFKTTENMEKLLDRYETTEIDRAVNPFGYPLTTWKVIKPKGMREWVSKLSAEPLEQRLLSGRAPELRLRWGSDDSVSLRITELASGKMVRESPLTTADTLLTLPEMPIGPHHFALRFSNSDGDSTTLYRDLWVDGGSATLLSEMIPLRHKTEWGELKINRSVDNNGHRASGIPFTWGLGIHAPSQIDFALNGVYSTLRFVAALDDESLCGDGAVFEVEGDGQKLWSSPPLYAMELRRAEISVKGVKQLTLRTLQRDNNMCDHTEWLHAWLE